MSTPDNRPSRAFISHSSDDARIAQKICALLEARGTPCWIAPRDVSLGKAYGEEIIHAIESCDVLILVLSSGSNASNAVTSEVERAFSKKKLIIPIRIEEVLPAKAIEFFVASAQWVDAWASPIETAVSQVATAIQKAAGQPVRAERPLPPAARKLPRSPILISGSIVGLMALIAILVCGTWLMHRTSDEGGLPLQGALAPEAAAVLPRYHALVVGINDYTPYDGQGWAPLETARADAAAVADVLERQYGFHVSRLFDADATRARMLQALDALVSLDGNDALLVYFAGHGFYDEATAEGYWIPADAHKNEGSRLAKQDWIWNSTLSTLLGACGARHVLVVADSCYAGSLFRGSDTKAASSSLTWYRRALQTPSRYLLASGNMEPVLDSGGKHSVFGQQLLDFLANPQNTVFSASDIALHVRSRVGELTGQMVRMGPLKSQRHGGGEFVFVRSGESLGTGPSSPAPLLTPDDMPGTAFDMQQQMTSALSLARGGATNAASHIVKAALGQDANSRLAQAVEAHLSQERKAAARDALQQLITTLEKREQSPSAAISVRPRILACLGPSARPGSSVSEDTADLYQICVRSELESLGRSVVVEREALEAVLQEMNLGTSDLADSRARLTIGKLLPAGLLLIGDIIPTGTSGEKLFMRIVDTETTRVMATVSDQRGENEDPSEPAMRLAQAVLQKVIELKPITAQAAMVGPSRLSADIGHFHGVDEGMEFVVLERIPATPESATPYRAEEKGRGRVVSVTEEASELDVAWTTPPDDAAGKRLWIQERNPDPAKE